MLIPMRTMWAKIRSLVRSYLARRRLSRSLPASPELEYEEELRRGMRGDAGM